MSRRMRRSLVYLGTVGASLFAPAAQGNESRDVESVFYVAKSENKNQVHYGIALDAWCAPVGDTPVFVYWRMREVGPSVTESLLPREVPAYGLAEQRVLDRSPDGGRVTIALRALPSRPIVITTAAARRRV